MLTLLLLLIWISNAVSNNRTNKHVLYLRLLIIGLLTILIINNDINWTISKVHIIDINFYYINMCYTLPYIIFIVIYLLYLRSIFSYTKCMNDRTNYKFLVVQSLSSRALNIPILNILNWFLYLVIGITILVLSLLILFLYVRFLEETHYIPINGENKENDGNSYLDNIILIIYNAMDNKSSSSTNKTADTGYSSKYSMTNLDKEILGDVKPSSTVQANKGESSVEKIKDNVTSSEYQNKSNLEKSSIGIRAFRRMGFESLDINTRRNKLLERDRVCEKLEKLFKRNDAKGIIDKDDNIMVDVPESMHEDKYKEIKERVFDLDVKYAKAAEVCDEKAAKSEANLEALFKSNMENLNDETSIAISATMSMNMKLDRAEKDVHQRYENLWEKEK